jgi:Holliday junction resolvase RusA-like endonuclease
MMHATFLLPPSVNSLFRTTMVKSKTGGRDVPLRVKTGPYKKWLKAATGALARQIGAAGIKGRVIVITNVERPIITADLDNRLKACLDALVEARVIEDDKQIASIATAWTPKIHKRGEHTVDVWIVPEQEFTLTYRPAQQQEGTGGWWHPDMDREEDFLDLTF